MQGLVNLDRKKDGGNSKFSEVTIFGGLVRRGGDPGGSEILSIVFC